MKVICIDGIKPLSTVYSFFGQPMTSFPGDEIFEGEKYTVVAELLHDGVLYYGLAERDFTPGIWYKAKKFAPVSSIDETEFERHYNIAIN